MSGLLLGFEFADVRRAISVCERALADEKKAQEERSRIAMQEMIAPPLPPGTTRTTSASFATMMEDMWDARTLLPALLRRSLFITLYSLVEYELNSWCVGLQDYKKLSRSLKDVKGEGIHRARGYLKTIAKFEFPDQSPEWNTLTDFNKLRNVLAHNGGRVPDGTEYDDLINRLHRHKRYGNHIHIDSSREVAIDAGFCEQAVEEAERFMTKLLLANAAEAGLTPEQIASAPYQDD